MQRLFNERVKSPLSYYGGKSTMVDFVLPHFPPHRVYCEAFGGSGAMLFAKPPAELDVYNDVDAGLANFFRVLKDPRLGLKLTFALKLTPNSRLEHARCRREYPSPDPVEWARQHFVLLRQSYSSIFAGSWGYSVASRGTAFHTGVSRLPDAAFRLQDVAVENLHFSELFDKYDAEDVLWYLDPPYLGSTRVSEKVYANELSDGDHRLLLSRILGLKGMVVLSGYPSRLYDDALCRWRRVTKTVRCLSSPTTAASGRSTKPPRTEVLWVNAAAAARNRLPRRRGAVA
jgi:DNA adenine methylase